MGTEAINNLSDNLNLLQVNPSDSNSDISIEQDIVDENFYNVPSKTFSSLYTDEVFLADKALFTKNFLDAIRNYELEDFYYSFADKTFDLYYQKYNIAAVEWLNNIFLNNLNNSSIICGVLKVLSNIEYSKLQTFGYTIVLLAMHNNNENEDLEVTDLIIGCIENWDNKTFVQILNNLKTKANFLDLYRSKILKAIAA
jgi:hypothetical protein